MKTEICPNCQFHNNERITNCANCGFTFSVSNENDQPPAAVEFLLRSSRINLIFLIFSPLIIIASVFFIPIFISSGIFINRNTYVEIPLLHLLTSSFMLRLIISGVLFGLFIIMRDSNQIHYSKNNILISRLFKKDRLDRKTITSLKIKFKGRPSNRQGIAVIVDFLFDNAEIGGLEVEFNADKVYKSKFTNMQFDKTEQFIEYVTKLHDINPKFIDHKKQDYKEYSWVFVF